MGVIQTFLCCVFALLLLFLSSSHGLRFNVGGKEGWIVHPSENYNHWAERNRFQVNDTLYFKFTKGKESVLVVTRENYNTCNTKDPIKSYTEGDSEYKFERSGPHYFISGNSDHCTKGQKLIVVVLAVRPKKSPPTTPAPTPAPAPTHPAPTPAPTPLAPPTPAPALAPPTPTPASGGPGPSPAGAADSPAPGGGKDKKSGAGRVVGYPSVMGVVVGLAIGVGVVMGGLN